MLWYDWLNHIDETQMYDLLACFHCRVIALIVTSTPLVQSYSYPGASEATLKDMGKYIMWILLELLVIFVLIMLQ